MSQTTKTLKKLASGEEYKALVAAIEQGDCEATSKAYLEIERLLQEAQKEIREKIASLPRQNKDVDSQKFQAAFAYRVKTELPKWQWLESEIKVQKVMEGHVFGFGTKGDPLVRTPEGRVVVLRDCVLKEGDKVRFKVLAEGTKIDFGRAFELTPNFFYLIMNREAREKVINSLESVRDRLEKLSAAPAEAGLSEFGEILKELENVREASANLSLEEKERAAFRIAAYRKRIMKTIVSKLAFELLSREEEKEIQACCEGDEQQLADALAAPGLFRRESHEAIMTDFSQRIEKSYSETLSKMESNLNSMKEAMEFMEFESGMKEVHPQAKRYLERMDRLFERLSTMSAEVALTLAEDKLSDVEGIYAAIKNAFSGENLSIELRRAFRNAEEFFALRGALMELKGKVGDDDTARAEAAIKPYLRQKIALAFGSRR